MEKDEERGAKELEVRIYSIATSLTESIIFLDETGGSRIIPIWIGPMEAQAIAIRLSGYPSPRPMTHDLLKNLIEALDARVLTGSHLKERVVEHMSVGAMTVEAALPRFRRMLNKAVFTGGDRTDIQAAALETSTKCIILTGGLQTNEVVLGKAQSRGVPILSVPDDTFSAINKIELLMGKSSILDAKKMDRVRDLFSAGFDMYGFLKKVDKV